MRVAVFSTKPYDETYLTDANGNGEHDLRFIETRLSPATVVLAEGCEAVCVFVNDDVSAEVVTRLGEAGVALIALRSAGYNHVDLGATDDLGLTVVRVPEYSPHAVAEHCLGLILALDRKIHRAYNRVRENNFSLTGLLGFDLHGKTVGVVGTGRIGTRFIELLTGFGTNVLAFDPVTNGRAQRAGASYHPLEDVLASSDIVSLHCPLTPETRHLIDSRRLETMRDGVMLINTSRGALVDAAAVVAGLKSGKIGHLGLDVYEEEADLFFEDLSDIVPQDDIFARLLSFPNVLITGHQAFFTVEAMTAIAQTTMANISAFERGASLEHQVRSTAGRGQNGTSGPDG